MIHRDDHTDSYMVISNGIARDERLTLEARGLLVFMLSMSDEWNFSINGLVSQTGSNRKMILRLVKELKAAGYLVQTRQHGKGGIYTACRWDLYENCTTVPKNHSAVKPQCGKWNCGENENPETPLESPQFPKTTVSLNHSTVKPQYRETTVPLEGPIRNTNIERNTKEKEIGKRFAPPTVEEVAAYCLERGNDVNADDFVNFYTSKGWMVGKNKMKDWKAAVRTWESKDRSHAASKKAKGNEFIDMLREEAVGND